jgi:hypothetical protein
VVLKSCVISFTLCEQLINGMKNSCIIIVDCALVSIKLLWASSRKKRHSTVKKLAFFFTEQNRACSVRYRAKPSGTKQNRAKLSMLVKGPVPGSFLATRPAKLMPIGRRVRVDSTSLQPPRQRRRLRSSKIAAPPPAAAKSRQSFSLPSYRSVAVAAAAVAPFA